MLRLLRFVVAALVVLTGLVTATSTPAVADDPTWGQVVPGEYIIELKPDGSAAAVAVAVGALQPPQLLSAGSAFVRLVLDPTLDPNATVNALLNTTGVELAQPNLVSESSDYLGLRRKFFTDLDVAQVTTSATDYRIGQPGLRNAGLPAGTNAAGVRVAVLDTGVATSHPKLLNRIAPGGYDFVDLDASPVEVANGIDDNANGAVDEAFGHGTFVAGLVALVAPGARVLPVRVLDSDGVGSTWTIMRGIAWSAAKGAQVINLSLGGSAAGPVADRQLLNVEAAGIVVVASAGNGASTSEVAPAASDGVVGVSAINGRTATAATFSNRGSWIDVAAPGVSVVSLYPGGRFATWGGTSASAPIVAGALAIITRIAPGAADDRVDHLTSTARPDGLGDLSAHGRVDIAAAVRSAQGF